jgi:hypothetical protein
MLRQAEPLRLPADLNPELGPGRRRRLDARARPRDRPFRALVRAHHRTLAEVPAEDPGKEIDMSIRPLDAWTLRRVLTGQSVNGQIDAMDEPWQGIAKHLAGLGPKARAATWDSMLLARQDRAELINVLAAADPLGPAPQIRATTFATAGDIRRTMSTTPWIWKGWIRASSIVGLAGPEGTGKTRWILDLMSRMWNGREWPDGQPMALPKGTPSLWICADGHQDEIVDIMPAFGLPDEAVIFPAPPDDPYSHTSLDDPETLARIDAAVRGRKPGFTIVDSLTYATARDLCEQRSIAILKVPLVNLCQAYQINVLLSLHVSKEGQAFGRRIKGITRTLMHLECPDPDHPERLRLWMEKTHEKRPPALGVTMGDKGNTYDSAPPAKLDPSKGGRPPREREQAIQFIRDSLSQDNNQIGNDLCEKFIQSGGSERTFWRGVRSMQGTGEVVADGGTGTGKQTLLHLNEKSTTPPQASA